MRTLEMELFFDTYDTKSVVKKDVRTETNKIRQADGHRSRAARAAGAAGLVVVASARLRAGAGEPEVRDVLRGRHAGAGPTDVHVQRVHRSRTRGAGRSAGRPPTSARCTSSSQGETLSGIAAQRLRRTRSCGARSRSRTGSTIHERSRQASRCVIPSLPCNRSRHRGGACADMPRFPSYAPEFSFGSAASRSRRRCAHA